MNNHKLWTEKYRPSKLDDYVWADESQHQQVQNWVREKHLPNLLLSGGPGIGKCLGKDERITIRANQLYLKNGIYENNNLDWVRTSISMLELFSLLGLQDISYNIAHDIKYANIEVDTPSGWQPILALVRKHTEATQYTLANGLTLTCATKHLVFENGECKPIDTCFFIDTLDGTVEILSCEPLGEIDLYDIAVPSPHIYVTANGIIHHNTTLAKCLLNELGVENSDIRYVNGSHTNGVDDIRNLSRFAETMPSGEFRYVLIDECLDENTLVCVLRNGSEIKIAIKDLDQENDLVKSFNIEHQRIEWRPFVLMDKGNREVLEIEFENGHVVICTPNHKWYVSKTEIVKADELYQFGYILTVNFEKLAIYNIKKIEDVHRVYDLSVDTNHNFILGNGILTHNCDYLSPNAQAALRNMIEEYSSVCRWIMTCNYPNKIIPALKSRTQGFHMEHLDREQFLARIANILVLEGIELTEENLEILDEYFTATYPDLRKCINMLQQNCSNGKLNRPSEGSTSDSQDYIVHAVALFKQNKIHDARKLICTNIRSEEFEEMYRLLYRNLNWWGDTETKQNQATVIIANRLRDHALCADGELNLAACLIELADISNS